MTLAPSPLAPARQASSRKQALRLILACALGIPGIGAAGCQSYDLVDCRIVGGSGRLDNGYYSVTILVENRSSEVLDLSQLEFEMTTYDSQDRILDRDYRFLSKGTIQPFDNNRIPLSKLRRDTDAGIVRSRIVIKDKSGNLVSEWSVGDPAGSPSSPPPGHPAPSP